MKKLVLALLTLNFMAISKAEIPEIVKAPQTKIQQMARARRDRLEAEEKEKEDVKKGIKKSIKKIPATLEESLKANGK